MSQGPTLIFDKSTLESLSVNEAVLLDHFYRSNITPVFFVECLADLERKMIRMKGTPEQLVGSLAERTPDSQSSVNVHHMYVLHGELSGQFDINTVLLRAFIPPGKTVQLGDSKGMIFRPSDEEQALQRWARHEFLDLERQIAKGWRRMIEQIDIQAMAETVVGAIGPWRKPNSLTDARALTDLIIDSLEPEWLLRFGAEILGVLEAINFDLVVSDWKAAGRKPLREHLPYFTHMLALNIFFGIVLRARLLKNVKSSHAIDVAYLYYLPFCAIFSSRDNFHVEVAPLFMHPAQKFVHGDDLKADLKKLNEIYLRLPKETRDKSLYSFAEFPPDDNNFLTTRLWDAYLPKWRRNSKRVSDVPQKLKDGMTELLQKYDQAKSSPKSPFVSVDELSFAQLSRQIKPVKGDYFRIAKDIVLKNYEEELKTNAKIYPPGTQFPSLVESLTELFDDPTNANIDVNLISYKLDGNGEKTIEEGQHVVEIRAFAIQVFGDDTRIFLKQEYEKYPMFSIIVLWTKYGVGKLGILRLRSVSPDTPESVSVKYEDWEIKAIKAYMHRHNL